MGESSRLGSLRGVGVGGGEIVEVQGGHIVRSTGRKDRHSKVCTAKGPRDRRVRLAAHTAIQFYDVQDRLGYDRPSKAVDWLIKKAKAAIDELEELPAWHPTTGSTAIVNFEQQQENNQENSPLDSMVVGNNQENPNGNSSSFLPPSMDSDSIADTIKSFFPMGASTEANTSAMQQFQSFPPPDLLSRTSNHSQDLRLSLQSFQDPIMLHHHHTQQSHHFHNPSSHNEQEQQVQTGFFTGATPAQLSFDGSGWSEQHQNHHQQQQPTEFNRFQRLSSWNPGGDTGGTSGGATPGGGGAGGGYLYNSASGPSLLQPFFGQNQFFSQRGPLQSSNTSSIRAWMDPSSAIAMANNTDHSHQNHQHHHQQQPMIFNYQPAISGIGFASGVGGFSDFRIPSRIQGDDEEHDGISDKPSSASSDSHH